MNPLYGCMIVLGALTLLIGGVKVLGAGGRLGAETSRKLVHMGMGVVCLSFPLLFTSIWPVWGLAAIACVALGLLRVVPQLKRSLGGVLHGVERASWGELYFPLGVATVFTLAGGRPLLFVVPVAVLTFADAFGALIGRRYGRHRFTTLEGTKTLEGSLAVGLSAFVCALIPSLFYNLPPAQALLIGALVGLFSALVEAISWRGLDNFFLPLATFAQMSIYLALPEVLLLERLGVLVLIALAAFIWRRGRLVDDSARIGGALALYFFWTVGGWTWLVAPVVLLASYTRLMPTVPGGVGRHNLLAVICVASTALVWCLANVLAPDGRWLWPYTLGIAAQQAVIAIVRFSQGRSHWPRFTWWAIGTAQALSLHFLAFWLLDRGSSVDKADYAWGAVAVALASAGFVLWEKQLQLPSDLNLRWLKQGTTALVASSAGLISTYECTHIV